jgi:hypothetical protein
MGKLIGGIFGQVKGKVGKVVSYKLLGEDVVRMVGKNNHEPTLAQLDCRQRLKVLAGVQKPIKEFIKIGFRYVAAMENKYPANIATSYNYQHALTGDYPDIAVDFPKLRVAQGELPMAINATVEEFEQGLRFSWDTGDWMDFDERRHRAMLMAYFPELQRATFHYNGATRYDGIDILPVAENLRGAFMETYLSFVDLGSGKAANSVYVGSLNI